MISKNSWVKDDNGQLKQLKRGVYLTLPAASALLGVLKAAVEEAEAFELKRVLLKRQAQPKKPVDSDGHIAAYLKQSGIRSPTGALGGSAGGPSDAVGSSAERAGASERGTGNEHQFVGHSITATNTSSAAFSGTADVSGASKASRAARASSSRSQKRPAPQTLVRGDHGKFSKRTTTSTSATPEMVKTTGTTLIPACDEEATDQAETLTDSTSSVIVVQPPPPPPIELLLPTPTELADCIITYAILPYLHFHSHTVIEYESRRQLVSMHYWSQLIAFIDSETRKVQSHSYKTLDLIVSKCA